MYNKILVPIEFSHVDTGINAIQIAKKLLNKDGQIFLLSVIGEMPSSVEVQLSTDWTSNNQKMAYQTLAKIANNEGTGLNVEIMFGHAANSILSAAETHRADLIIIASHKPGLSDYFLGSTAARVVRHAQCPVLVNR
ncbi:MAG: universal stress protein [Hyphomicrobiales bacterium]|nr:universal stress protein [Hyphomicrobiales bacterium]